VERWLGEAREGRFEVLPQNGHLVGAPTYLPVGELAICRPLAGEVPRPGFPEPLARSAAPGWDGRARVALRFAQGHAAVGDAVCCAGMLVHATLCIAHARLAARREWVLNEKRLVQRAGLDHVQSILAAVGATPAELTASVAEVGTALQAEPLATR